MLRFPYKDELLTGPSPPTLPSGAGLRWRPLVPVQVIGPVGVPRQFLRAVVDPAADDTGNRVRWRGQLHPLRFGDVEIVLDDGVSVLRWSAVVGFSSAPLRYLIPGQGGCLQFFDATFRGVDQIVELEPNRSYAGTP